jgi:hypothetical protein
VEAKVCYGAVENASKRVVIPGKQAITNISYL